MNFIVEYQLVDILYNVLIQLTPKDVYDLGRSHSWLFSKIKQMDIWNIAYQNVFNELILNRITEYGYKNIKDLSKACIFGKDIPFVIDEHYAFKYKNWNIKEITIYPWYTYKDVIICCVS